MSISRALEVFLGKRIIVRIRIEITSYLNMVHSYYLDDLCIPSTFSGIYEYRRGYDCFNYSGMWAAFCLDNNCNYKIKLTAFIVVGSRSELQGLEHNLGSIF